MVVLDILVVCVLMSVISLAVVDIVKWSDLHTIGDFFAPMDNKFDSVVLYVPAVNLVVASVVIAAVMLMLVESAVNRMKDCKVFSPMKNFFGIRIK